ncbi:MAG: ABC transporter permease [Acidobacteria bacterium]|nr:ABC transporter permease [Acidobacteriota bacterium]
MLWLSRLSHALRSLFRKQQMEQELDEELRFHLERQTAENIKAGMSPAEAHRAARLELGGVEQVKQKVREVGMGRILEELWQDVRFGIRMLARNPGFTAVAVLTLALGIGANTAIFSMVNGVLLRSLPYQQGDRLIVLRQQQPGAKIVNLPFSVKEILDYREQNQTLDEVVEHHIMEFTLLGRGEPQQVLTGVVSANFFDVLGLKPLLGRTFLPGEDELGTEPILVLTYEYWQGKQGGDPDIVGKTFELNGNMHTVVGVLPPVPQYPAPMDVYMPTSHCPTRSRQSFIENRTRRMMRVFGRLKPGVTPEQAQSDVAVIAQRLRQDYPDVYPEPAGYTAVSTPLKMELTKQARPTLLILMGTVGLVLLIACANVANLFLVRAEGREPEMAVRSALGASRGRLARYFLAEIMLLAGACGLLGLWLAWVGVRVLLSVEPAELPRLDEVGIDAAALGVTVGVSLIATLLFGAISALRPAPSMVSSLGRSGRGSTASRSRFRARNALVVSQVAFALVLLVGAGLMARSFWHLLQVDPGFEPAGVLTFQIMTPEGGAYSMSDTRLLHAQLVDRMEVLPGVERVGTAGHLVLTRRFGVGDGDVASERTWPDQPVLPQCERRPRVLRSARHTPARGPRVRAGRHRATERCVRPERLASGASVPRGESTWRARGRREPWRAKLEDGRRGRRRRA